MSIETNKMVSATRFVKEWHRFRTMARNGSGPIAVTEENKVVGVYIGAEEYEAMFGEAVKDLLRKRMKGPKVTHEEVKSGVEEILRKAVEVSP